MLKLGIWRMVSIGLIGSVTVLTTSLLLMGFTGQNCRTQISPLSESNQPPRIECFATSEEAMVNVVYINKAEITKEAFSILFKGWAAPQYTDADKPYCAFMLKDYSTRFFRAACGNSIAELESLANRW